MTFHYFWQIKDNLQKLNNMKSILITVIALMASAFSVCASPQTPIKKLEKLVEKVEKKHASYDEEDWKEVAEEYADKLVVAKVDVDNCQAIAMKYGIRNIPTILFIKDGAVVDKQVGAVQKSALVAKVENVIK